jgi:polysaccharide export outer membrane protein
MEQYIMDQRSFFALLLALICFSSCSSYKNVPYLKDLERFTAEDYAKSAVLYTVRIKPKDLMRITVSAITNPEDVYSFNLVVPSPISAAENISTQLAMKTYLVDNNRNVNFSVFWSIKLSELTKTGDRRFTKTKT